MEDPIYLANGEATYPLGTVNLELMMHGLSWEMPIVVLPSDKLAFVLVLGLDFIYVSCMQIDASAQSYNFKGNETRYPFQPGAVHVVAWIACPLMMAVEEHVCTSVYTSLQPMNLIKNLEVPIEQKRQDLIGKAVEQSSLPSCKKDILQAMLQDNFDVCTLEVGRTSVLQHKIITFNAMPIKQRSYRMSDPKRDFVKEEIEEMLGKRLH